MKQPRGYLYQLVTAASAVAHRATAASAVVTVAVHVQKNEDEDNYPNIAFIKNIAKTAHNYIRPF